MDKKYLPSRQFIINVIVIVVFITVVLSVYKLSSYFKNRSLHTAAPTKVLVKDVVQKDSNNNGIPDWEEILWGLDPSKNGPSNKEFIMAKQDALSKDNGTQADSSAPTANDALSQQFFSVVMSLQATGNLNDASMQSLSDIIGKKIIADPIADVYTRDMMTVKIATPTNISKYANDLKNLMLKYQDKDIGNELTFIAQGVKRNDPQALYLAGTIADQYKAFANDLIKIPVPDSFSENHLSMANNYDKVSQSIQGLLQIITDPMVGMKAIINYKNYTDALVANIKYLSDNLK